MDEYFLQYLWNFQKFDAPNLQLVDGVSLTVFKTGFQNHDSGPDFLEAQLKLDELTWSGSVEIHYKSSDWKRHGHSTDRAYDNVILHVVWEHDCEIEINGKAIPTFEMKHFVSTGIEQSYRHYINQPQTIRCTQTISEINEIHIHGMLDKALAARLQQKGRKVTEILKDTDGDWEETAYRVICRNFGFKTNDEAFRRLAESLPYHILRKYHQKEDQVFALIFGMAGYLEKMDDEYQSKLRSEFDYLVPKHGLSPNLMRHHWKHGKMRPANFPSIRLAQFATFIAHSKQIFAHLLNIADIKSAQVFLNPGLPAYWQTHYDFNKPSTRHYRLGKSSINTIIINSIVPILTAYAKYLDEVKYLEQASQILENLSAESNHIINQWKSVNITPSNAADSQALIFQYNELCKKKKCLRCNIGVSILNKTFAS
ncbi:MAG: DUF2851 family protein [Marinoscillum sp.]